MEDQNLAPAGVGPGTSTPQRPAPRPPLPSPRLRSWVLEVTASPACAPLGDGRFVLRIPVDQLAVELGYTPRSGSLSRRLRRLQECGVVVSRRPVVFDVSRLITPAPVSPPPPIHATGNAGSPQTRFDTPSTERESPALEDAAARTALLALEAFRLGDREVSFRALDVLAGLRPGSPPPSLARDVDANARIVDGFARVETSSAFLSEKKSSPSSPSRSTRRESVDPVLRPPRPRVPDARRQRRMDELLLPLLEECVRLGLPGMSSRSGVYTALAPLSDPEIASGVETVCGLLASGTSLRSPVGLLVSLARRGELQASRAMRTPEGSPPTHGSSSTAVALAPPAAVGGDQHVTPADGDEWLRDVRAFMAADLPAPGDASAVYAETRPDH